MATNDNGERVEAWTVTQTAELLSATSISPPTHTTRAAAVTLAIPLDDTDVSRQDQATEATGRASDVYKRREPLRRDSLKRRESFLKGKEGSRQRRRWENDRLLGNPHAVPPRPEDWQVHATYPVRRVPYVLAPLWDVEYARAAQKRWERDAARRVKRPEEAAADKVARELRAKLKRARGARGLLQDLETHVRAFVEQWEAKARRLERDGLVEPDSDEDDEIVFVGRGGAMHDEARTNQQPDNLRKEKMIFESMSNDQAASFSRYLVHSIAEYYGLQSWSTNIGNRREAYVSLPQDPRTRKPSLSQHHMPRPLWAVV